MRSRKPPGAPLYSQRNLTKYPASVRPIILAFVRQKSAEFQDAGGKFRAPKTMRGFASFNAATKIINLSRSEMADAKLAALVEELLHFEQAQTAGVFGEPGGWFSRYTSQEWQDLSLTLEAEVDEKIEVMGFER